MSLLARIKHADISAMAPSTFKPAPPLKPGRQTGEAFNANKSYYQKGYGPPVSTTKTALLGSIMGSALGTGARRMLASAPIPGAGMMARGIGAAGSAIGSVAGIANHGPGASVLGMPLGRQPGQVRTASYHPVVAAFAEQILGASPEARKEAMEHTAAHAYEPAAVSVGRALFRPLVLSGLVRID